MFGGKKDKPAPMLVVTIPELPGRQYDVLGLVVSETGAALNDFDLEKLLKRIEPAARKIGADAVIGAQVVVIPQVGAFKYAVFGTAIRFRE